MDYELVKELDMAGFPNLRGGPFWDVEGPQGERLKVPTLSDMIQACGANAFSGLHYYRNVGNDYWWSSGHDGSHHVYEGTGQSPEEAVARLWLQLDKKAA
jgi:hypothetical protein